MERIIVVSYTDIDVTPALTELVTLNSECSMIIPVTENRTVAQSAVDVARKLNRPYHLFFSETDDFVAKLIEGAEDITVASNPIREAMREVTPGDILAIAWDDSVESHMVLHSVEDYGVVAWDISENLEVIEVSSGDDLDDLHEEMQDALANFIEVFSAYIAAGVIEAIGKSVEETLLGHIQNFKPREEE